MELAILYFTGFLITVGIGVMVAVIKDDGEYILGALSAAILWPFVWTIVIGLTVLVGPVVLVYLFLLWCKSLFQRWHGSPRVAVKGKAR